MNKSYYVHFKNKFPGADVRMSEDSLDVYSKDGEHLLAVRKDGAGQWNDKSEELGLPYRLDLAPISKDARIHKLFKDGKCGLDDMAEERKEKSKSWKTGHEIESEFAYQARKKAKSAKAA